MKGIIFNLLGEVIIEEHGEDAWDGVLEECGLSGPYTSLGSYADSELFQLVDASSRSLKLSRDTVLRWFGRKSMPKLAEHYPSFFEGHRSTRSFLLTVNTIIHPEVRKLHPGTDVPEFEFDTKSNDVLIMAYRSSRKLCSLAKGLIEGAAEHYRENVAIEELQCMHAGHEKCLLGMTFSPRV